MIQIDQVFKNQIRVMHERNWDTIYVAVDWHDTMMKATYSNDDYGKYELYDWAEDVLKWMSDHKNIKLILFTSSHDEQVADFIQNMATRYGIMFDYHNGNPEVQNTETGDFSKKFYFNVLLDDKAGFEPEEDWCRLFGNIVHAEKDVFEKDSES